MSLGKNGQYWLEYQDFHGYSWVHYLWWNKLSLCYISIAYQIVHHILNSFAPRLIQAVNAKTPGSHVVLHGNFSSLVSATDPAKSSKHLASLVVCIQKFWLGVWICCEWHHKWRTFRPPWPTSPGPGPKSLDGSILLKFLLETSRLQSESYTLVDLLEFRVQKLWSKVINIFD